MQYRGPRKLGRYEVVREIGRGAMGLVLEGNDTLLGRRVALKLIDTSRLSGDPTQRASAISRFYSEASAAGRLSHPNLMTVFDLGEEEADGEKINYMALEYIEGVDLSTLMHEGKRLETERVVGIVRQAAEGLVAAHDQGVVHRDIKPSNIRLQAGDRVKITDFGLARLPDSSLTVVGSVMGTPEYMSPEQVEGGKVEPASDIFSLTVILYELLTGARLFKGESLSSTIAKVLTHHPAPPSAQNPSLGDAFDELVARGLRKDSQRRLSNGRDFLALLDRAETLCRDRKKGRERGGDRPELFCYFDDETLVMKGGRLLKAAGFGVPLIFKSAPLKELAKSMGRRLTEGGWGIVHFKSRLGAAEGGGIVTVIDLLREIRRFARPERLARLVPVFMGSVDPDRQRELFRRLAPFGVQSALVLNPVESANENVRLMVDEINRLSRRDDDETGTVLFHEETLDIPLRRKEDMGELIREAHEAIAKKRYKVAVDLLNRALSIAPEPVAFIERGDAHYRLSRYMEALRDYRSASQLEMNGPELLARIGSCCLSLTKTTKETNEEEAARWLDVGMKSLAKAEEDIDRLMERYEYEPEQLPPHPYRPLLSALREVGTDYGAFAGDEKIAQLSHRVLGKAKADSGAHFAGMMEDQEASIDYAALLGDEGAFDDAERILITLLPKNPASVGPELNNLAIKMRHHEMTERAFHIYLKLLEHPVPDREIILRNMRIAGVQWGKTLRSQGEGEEAIEAFRQVALHVAEGRELLMMEMAAVCLDRGWDDRAREYARQAIRLSPDLRNDTRYVRQRAALGEKHPATPHHSGMTP